MSSYDEPVSTLSKRDIAELVYFVFQLGFIHQSDHERVHELIFNWKCIMDDISPGWSPNDLKEIVGKMRNGNE
jgi:hypothetical protein